MVEYKGYKRKVSERGPEGVLWWVKGQKKTRRIQGGSGQFTAKRGQRVVEVRL